MLFSIIMGSWRRWQECSAQEEHTSFMLYEWNLRLKRKLSMAWHAKCLTRVWCYGTTLQLLVCTPCSSFQNYSAPQLSYHYRTVDLEWFASIWDRFCSNCRNYANPINHPSVGGSPILSHIVPTCIVLQCGASSTFLLLLYGWRESWALNGHVEAWKLPVHVKQAHHSTPLCFLSIPLYE